MGDPNDPGDAALEAAAVAASDGAVLAPALPLLVPPEHPATVSRKISPINCARIGRSYRETLLPPFCAFGKGWAFETTSRRSA